MREISDVSSERMNKICGVMSVGQCSKPNKGRWLLRICRRPSWESCSEPDSSGGESRLQSQTFCRNKHPESYIILPTYTDSSSLTFINLTASSYTQIDDHHCRVFTVMLMADWSFTGNVLYFKSLTLQWGEGKITRTKVSGEWAVNLNSS